MTRPAYAFGPALLFCPADRPDRYAKALERADAVILDLEDAVAAAAKPDARRALAEHPLDPDRVIVRVNPARTAELAADLAVLAGTEYRTLMLAKCEGADDVGVVEAAAPGRYSVIGLCETAAGVLAAERIAAADPVVALMWGAEDLVASLGGTASRFDDGRYRDVARYARSHVRLAAAAHGAAAIDAVHLDLGDEAGLAAEAADAAALGFDSTACLHPAQVPVVRAAYRPAADRLEWARAVLAAAGSEAGVFAFRGEMVDAPVLRQAAAILRRAGG